MLFAVHYKNYRDFFFFFFFFFFFSEKKKKEKKKMKISLDFFFSSIFLLKASIVSTHNLFFGSKIRKLDILLQTPVFLYKSGV